MKKSIFIFVGFLMVLGVSEASAQLIKTQLDVTIRNDTGNIVDSVSVKLFGNESDYKAEINAVAEGITDDKGVVKFKDIEAKSYYVVARKGDLNNFGGGEETGELKKGRFNKVTIVIN
jgi:hypothetical protein